MAEPWVPLATWAGHQTSAALGDAGMLSIPFRTVPPLLNALAAGFAGYAKTASMAATALTGDSLYFLLVYVLRFLRVAVLLAVWRAVLSGRGPEAGMSLPSTVTFTLTAAVFGSQLSANTGLDDLLWSGAIT